MVSFSSGLSFTNWTVIWLLVGNLDLWNLRGTCKTTAFFPWAATENDFQHTVHKARVLPFLSFFNYLVYSGSFNHASWKWLVYLAFLFDILITKNIRKPLNWSIFEINNIKYSANRRISGIYNMIYDLISIVKYHIYLLREMRTNPGKSSKS